MTVKIGLFGGSFDPVHRAHFDLAKQAMKQFALDRVIWIPAAVSPFKKNSDPLAAPQHRLAMVRLVTASEPQFEVSPYEIEKGGVSYSVDTLHHFQNLFKNAQFYWILGTDALAGIIKWKEPEALMRELIFLVAQRGKEDIHAPKQLKMKKINLEWNAISSTEIKSQFVQGRDWNQLDPKVADYIRSNKLYGVAA